MCARPLVPFTKWPPLGRLKGLQQLGASSHVFSDGNHSRFEHSMGVAYLGTHIASWYFRGHSVAFWIYLLKSKITTAGKFLKTIRSKQPELDISDKDVLCVEVCICSIVCEACPQFLCHMWCTCHWHITIILETCSVVTTDGRPLSRLGTRWESKVFVCPCSKLFDCYVTCLLLCLPAFLYFRPLQPSFWRAFHSKRPTKQQMDARASFHKHDWSSPQRE